ncbi:eCIS core domain-containing protein [Kitasatospora cinereorecta]|uniref:DUF4157 domain-containing protein n=1 Tax=Kitasatospora cinereorecta TaxID=285560 RepID=A0ABW0VMK2_9ACTN
MRATGSRTATGLPPRASFGPSRSAGSGDAGAPARIGGHPATTAPVFVEPATAPATSAVTAPVPAPPESAPVAAKPAAFEPAPVAARSAAPPALVRATGRAGATEPVPHPAAAVIHAAVSAPGHPLPPSLRGQMEAGFGRDLGRVRVHEGPSASVAAGALDARAFSLGPHLVFGPGEYRPDTPGGRGLIAHELAHVVQAYDQAGGHAAVVDDPRLEAEADRAVQVLADGARPVVDARPGTPLIRRASRDSARPAPVPAPEQAAAPGVGVTRPATASGPELRLPAGMKAVVDKPTGIGTEELVVELPTFALPVEKGAGDWVQKAYDDAAAGGRLVFSPLIEGNAVAGREWVAAYKEGGEAYKAVWLGAFGFPSTKALSNAVRAAAKGEDKNAETVRAKLADPTVKKVVTGLGESLKKAECDVDHIVEKQLGGTSIPSNLQLLTSATNRASGVQTYQALVDVVRQIRDPAMRGPNVRNLQIRIAKATVPSGRPDASFEIENLLRSGVVRGSDAEKAKAVGKPVALSAGGQGETVLLRDTGDTPLDSQARRIVTGMRLLTYRRAPAGGKSTRDTVLAKLDSRAAKATGAGSDVVLEAELVPTTAPAAAAPAGPEGIADPTQAPAGEARRLRLDKAKNTRIAFYYPYLSPGELTSVALDEQGSLSGEGVIRSSVPFLGRFGVVYAKDELKLVAPIAADQLVSPLPGAFRFTTGALTLQLSPSLVPSGELGFSVGPAAKPVLRGTLRVALQNGVLTAEGNLAPAGNLPGVTAAAGQVAWNPETGWSGKVTAATASLPRSTANVELGFRTDAGRFTPYATGALTTTVRNSPLVLGAHWDGLALSYSGSVTVDKPLPLVDSVKLAGRYGDRGMFLKGEATIVWKGLSATMKVEYNRTEKEEEGRFSGSATIVVRTAKADGSLSLDFDEQGRFWGKGSVGYQVTKDLRPVLGVEVTKEQRVRLFGEVAVGDIVLVRRWPSAQGGTVPLLKGVGAKFSFPTPVPGVTAYLEVRGSLELGYGVGPVMMKSVVFKGELYPFEPDPRVAAKLTGAFVVPAYAELAGTFGAYIGAEVALGAVGAKGGIDIAPSLRVDGEGGVAIDADYDKDGFSFDAVAYAKGRLTANVKVLLAAELYAVWGLFSHRWTYEVASASAQLGPELKLTLGRIAYAKNGQITWPDLSQIRVEPDSIDPVQVIKDMLGRGKAIEQ